MFVVQRRSVRRLEEEVVLLAARYTIVAFARRYLPSLIVEIAARATWWLANNVWVWFQLAVSVVQTTGDMVYHERSSFL